jgi:hypothetical protein
MRLTLAGEPRGKKDRPQLFATGGKPRMIPNQEYTDWLEAQLAEKHLIKQDLGDSIPLRGAVVIEIHVYRKANTGDLSNFVDAVGDAIQSDVWQCQNPKFAMVETKQTNKRTKVVITTKSKKSECRKKVVSDAPVLRCPTCNWPVMRRSRKGLGIIEDDRQIQEGHTFLHIDKANPRIEIELALIPKAQSSLFEAPAEDVDPSECQ